MTDLFFARSQMAMSLGFHIIFAAVGIGMPLLMAVAEGAHLRTGNRMYRELAERWAKGTAVLFAIGAVSGTVLSFELGLLWQVVAEIQPAKFAAMEAHYETEPAAPIVIGGIPDDEERTVHYGIEIPGALSFLAYRDVDAEVTGLEAFPRDEWPNTRIVHWAFDLMLLCAFLMLGAVIWGAVQWIRRREVPRGTWFLRAMVFTGPLGFIAIEAGWVVTEVGRQPWIIYGVMRTEEAVTPMEGLVAPFTTFTILYLVLSIVLVFILRRQFLAPTAEESEGVRGFRADVDA